MRKLFCLVLLAACELKPAPKQAPPSASASAPAPTPAAPAPTEAAKPVEAAISAPCLDVATKIVQVFIDNAADPAQKSVYEQARANMVRKTGEACTEQGWSDEARSCYAASKSPAEIKACELKFPAPQPAQPPRPAQIPSMQPNK